MKLQHLSTRNNTFLKRNSIKIFLAPTSFARNSLAPLDLLQAKGYDIDLNRLKKKLSKREIISMASSCDAVLAGTEIYDRDVLNKIQKLRVISRLGVGLDNIDLKYADQKNIKVYVTQTNPSLAVAELTLGLVLDVLRKISLQSSRMKTGIWQKTMGSLLYKKTLGIIGLGTVGKQLVRLTRGFDLNYLAYDINVDEKFALKNKVKYCELDELLVQSDVFSIHLNLTRDTKKLINSDAFRNMKPSAILINTSRGEVVNEEDLIDALDSKLISGVGLDVFQEEPYTGPLLEYDNVVTTPHTGAYAQEIREQMEMEAAMNLIEGLEDD